MARNCAEYENIRYSSLHEAYYQRPIGPCNLIFMHEEISVYHIDTIMKIIEKDYELFNESYAAFSCVRI